MFRICNASASAASFVEDELSIGGTADRQTDERTMFQFNFTISLFFLLHIRLFLSINRLH